MTIFTTFQLLSIIYFSLALVNASPSDPSSTGGGAHFEIERRSPILSIDSIKRAHLNTRNKYPELNREKRSLWKRVMQFAVGKQISVGLDNVDNILFNCNVTFGNGQQFKMDLDTGSSDTWVRGAGCKSNDGSCLGASLKPDATMTDMKVAFDTKYGSGDVIGNIYQTPVQIGPFQAVVPIGISTSENGFSGDQTDGLMGLAFDSISSIAEKTGVNANFMDALFGATDNNLVSFYMPASAAERGQVTFGGMDESKFKAGAKMSFFPLNSKTYWQFLFTGSTFTVGGVTGDLAGAQRSAIVDTGTTLMIIDRRAAAAINKGIGATVVDPRDGSSYFPSCATAKQGPPLSITIAGVVYTIPASVYVIEDNSDPKQPVCMSGIIGSDPGDPFALLGDTFIRSVYTVFDKSRARIGFAQSI